VNYQHDYVKTDFLYYDKSTLSNEKYFEKLPATMATSRDNPLIKSVDNQKKTGAFIPECK